MTPRAGPRSQCAFGSKSNSASWPTVRRTTLSSSDAPIGVRSSGIFGRAAVKEVNSASTSATSLSSALILSPTSRMEMIFSSRSAAPFILPISFETVLRSAFSFSTSVRRLRRFSSSRRISSTGEASSWRFLSDVRIRSGCSRIRFRSNMLHLRAFLVHQHVVGPRKKNTPRSICRTRGRLVVPPALPSPLLRSTSPIFKKMGEAGRGPLGLRYNGRSRPSYYKINQKFILYLRGRLDEGDFTLCPTVSHRPTALCYLRAKKLLVFMLSYYS